MSTIPKDAPIVQINSNGLQDLISFIFSHEKTLKEFGAIKIQLDSDCLLALKKRRIAPTSTSIQQIIRVSDKEPIYTVLERDDVIVHPEQQLPITNEQTFWSSLPDSDYKLYQSSVSSIANKTLFYQKWNRKYFQIHFIPKHSLLKVGGKNVTDHFVPCLTRAHGSGAIYPLEHTQQRLSSLVYHHEGGARYWYVIPTNEQETLRKIVQQQNSSTCLEHGKLMLDPLFLDKHHIRYHRIVQYPNDFVVLAAGALTQSFTESESWSESIAFALPSWIEDGHATHRHSSCSCNMNVSSLTKTIDVSLFTHELIQNYIHQHLNIVIDGDVSVTQDERVPPMNMGSVKHLRLIISTHNQSSSPSIISPISNYFPNQDEEEQRQRSLQQQSDLNRNNKFHSSTDEDRLSLATTSTEPHSKDYFSEYSQAHEDQCYEMAGSMETPPIDERNEILEDQLSSFGDRMDITAETRATVSSISTQTEEPVNNTDDDHNKRFMYGSSMSTGTTATNIDTRNHVKEKKISETVNRLKTLVVLGLRHDVTRNDLFHHFTGCVKVTIKQCQTSSSLKYAFILHRTEEDAKRNAFRPIDHIRLGPQCRVKYADNSTAPSIGHRLDNDRTLVVKSIPEDVSEDDLRHLFPDCRISKYCPARTVYRTTNSSLPTNKTKAFWGYAFLVYNTVQEAVNVMEHANQYQINGRPLVVSLHHNTNQF